MKWLLLFMMLLSAGLVQAKTEDGTSVAQPVSAYGTYNGEILPLKVDSSGAVVLTGTIPSAAGWTESGTNVYLTTSTDNVGVGTTTPQAGFVSMNNVGIGTWTAAGGNLIVRGSGNVGIGTAWPGFKLDVTGGGRFSSSITTVGISNSGTALTNSASYTQSGTSANTFTGDVTITSGAGSGTPFQITGGDVSQVVNITSTGASRYNGYDATNDSAKILSMSSMGSTRAGTTANVNNTNLQTVTASGSGLVVGTVVSSPFILATNNLERVRIAADGNIGIGDDPTADATVDISKVGSIPPFMVSSSSSGDGDYMIIRSTGNVGIGTTITGNGGLLVMNGNVGIGTWKPTDTLMVKGGGISLISNAFPTIVQGGVSYSDAGAGTIRIGATGNANTAIISNNSDKMTILTTGNVGIGSTAPGMTLDVQGELRVSGVSGSGKAVCIKSTGDMGVCSDTVGAGGTCTCG